MIQGLSIDEIKNLDPQSPMWIAVNEDNRNNIGIGDRGVAKPAILMFLKLEDARHYARLLRENGPKDRLVDIEEVQLRPFIQSQAEKVEMNVVVVGPHEAREFFKTFGDTLWEYYE